MDVILRPGHGMTPPTPYSKNKKWMLQRPGNKEDYWTARFCSKYLIPALVREGHKIFPLRALHPVTGELNKEPVIVETSVLDKLTSCWGGEAWKVNAGVWGALNGVEPCLKSNYSWSHDLQSSCAWERSISDLSGKECYLSIHQNWFANPKFFGFNVFHSRSRKSTEYATEIYENVKSHFKNDPWAEETKKVWGQGRYEHRIKTGSRWGCDTSNLYEIRATKRPAILLEMGFRSNEEDTKRMNDPEWCSIMATLIATSLNM